MKFKSGSEFTSLPLACQVDSRPQSPDYQTADIDMTCTGRFACIDWYALTAADGILKVKNVRTLSGPNDLLIVPFSMSVAYPITSDDFSVMIGDQEATVVVNHIPAANNNFAVMGWTFTGIAYFFQTFESNPPRQQDIDFVFHGELGLFGPGPSCVGVALQALRVRNAENILPAADEKVLGAALHGREVEAISGAHQLGTGLTITTYGRKLENALGADPFEIIFDIVKLLIPLAVNTFYGAVVGATNKVMQISVEALRQFYPNAVTAEAKLQDARAALDTPNVALAKSKVQSAQNDIEVLAGLTAQTYITNALDALNANPVGIDKAKEQLDLAITSLGAWLVETQNMIDQYDTGELDLPPADPVNAALGLQNIAIPTSIYYEPLGAAKNDFQFDSPGRSQSFYAGDPTIPAGITYGVDLQLHTNWATTNAVSKSVKASWGGDPMRGATVTFPILTRSVDTLKELPAAPALPEDGPFFNKAVASTDSSGIPFPPGANPFGDYTNSWFRSDVGEIPEEPGTVVIVWMFGPPSVIAHPENVKLFCGDREMTCFGYRDTFANSGMFAYGFISGIDEVSSHEVLLCTGLSVGLTSTVVQVYTGVEEIGDVHVSALNNPATNAGVIRGLAGESWPRYLRHKVPVTADTRPKTLAQAFFGRYVNFTGQLDPVDHFDEYSQTGRGGLGRIGWADGPINGGLLCGDAGPYIFEEDGFVSFEYHETHVPVTDLSASSAGIAIELIGTGTAPSSTTIPRKLGTGQGWINFDEVDNEQTCLSEFDITVDDDATALVLWTFAPFVAITGITVDDEACEEFFHQSHSADDFSYDLFGHVIHVDKGTHTVAVQSSVDISGLTFVLKIDAYPGMGYHGDAFATSAQASASLTQTVTSERLVAQAFLCGKPALNFSVPDYSQKARRASESYQQLTQFETFQIIAGEAQDDSGSVTFEYDGTAVFTGTSATAYAHTFGAAVELSPTPISPPPVAPSITTTDLGDLVVGVPYELQLVATGTTPIAWTDPDDTLADSGLTLSSSGLLSGTPTSAGAYSFSFTATNDGGSDTQTYTGLVDEAPAAPPVITTTSLGTIYQGYSTSVNIAYTGSPATSVSTVSGALPSGLTVDVVGGVVTVYGTATNADESYTTTLRVTNADGYDDQVFSGTTVAAVAPTITTSVLTPVYKDTPYSKVINYVGTPVTSIAVTAGAFPDGLDIHLVNGVVTVSGTPTTLESYSVTVKFSNPAGDNSRTFTGSVINYPTPIEITTTELGPLAVGTPFSIEIIYTGTHSLTTATFTSGELPAGLTPAYNSGTGAFTISGTPTTAGPYSFTLQLGNEAGSDSQEFSGEVALPAAPTFVTTSLGGVYEGVAFSKEIEYTGDAVTAAVVQTGALPTGLDLDLSAGVVTISGTPTVLDEEFDFTLRLTNPVGDTDQEFSGTVTAAPPPFAGASAVNVTAGSPVSITTLGDTVVFHLVGFLPDPLPEDWDVATDGVLLFDGTPLTSLVTPFELIPGIYPYWCSLYVVHGIEAGLHEIDVAGFSGVTGVVVPYPGITGHGSVSTHTADEVTLAHTPTATSGNLVSQAYMGAVAPAAQSYSGAPRLSYGTMLAGEGEAPVTFTDDLTALLATLGSTWEDLSGVGYLWQSIAVELTGPRDAPAAVYSPGPIAVYVGVDPGGLVVQSTGYDIEWSITAGAVPSGMAFDKGVLYGIPDTASTGSFTVHVHNAHGDDEQTIEWTVSE